MGRGVLLTSNLPQLQNLIKRDPIAYKEEFLQQWNHYDSIRQMFKINPEEQAQHFKEIVAFISQVRLLINLLFIIVSCKMIQVATCYPKETAEFPAQISTLLLESYGILAPDTRKTLLQNLIMLRNKDVISSIELVFCISNPSIK
jgi:protein SDA1